MTNDLEVELRRANPHIKVKHAWVRDEEDTAPWKGELWEP